MVPSSLKERFDALFLDAANIGKDLPIPLGQAVVPGMAVWMDANGNLQPAVFTADFSGGSPPETDADFSDRVPANGHLCGRCSRIIAAQTDVES